MSTATAKSTESARLPGLIQIDGRAVRYHNAALPTRPDGGLVSPLSTCVCRVCGGGYAALMLDAACDVRAGVAEPVAYAKARRCAECRLAAWMLSPAQQMFRDGQGDRYVDDLEFFRSTISTRRDKSGRGSVGRIVY